MSIKTTVTVSRLEKHSIELNRETIIALLRKVHPNIPEGAAVYFRVPGGGDYSNCCIDIRGETPVHVQWNTETTKTEER